MFVCGALYNPKTHAKRSACMHFSMNLLSVPRRAAIRIGNCEAGRERFHEDHLNIFYPGIIYEIIQSWIWWVIIDAKVRDGFVFIKCSLELSDTHCFIVCNP